MKSVSAAWKGIVRSASRHGVALRRGTGRTGFTLVEMMVVIAIIAILAALLIPAIGMAMRSGKNGAMSMELSQLSQAIEAYAKDHADDYPPDFSNAEAFVAHMRKAYPRCQTDPATWISGRLNLDPAEALVFWLAGTINNPRNPLPLPTSTGEPKIYFDFDKARLVDGDNDGWPEFVPRYSKVPYVYFDGRIMNVAATANGPKFPTCLFAFSMYPSPGVYPTILRDATALNNSANATVDRVRPYRSNNPAPASPPAGSEVKTWPDDQGGTNVNNTLWINPGKFQIICAGLDSEFGHDNVDNSVLIFKQFPQPNYYVSGARDVDEDNLADFAQGKTIGDSIP